MSTSQVALIRGDSRYSNISQALALSAGDIDLSGRRHVLIKPNMVSTHQPQAATHVDALRPVLDFLRARYDGPVTIAEGPSIQPADEGFRRYGYLALAAEYGVAFLDLNHDEPVPVHVYDRRLRPLQLQVARHVIESDFRISVGPPKTHDWVIVTLSLKNMIMGSLISRFTHGRMAGPNSGQDGNGLNLGKVKKTLWRMIPDRVRKSAAFEQMQSFAFTRLEPSDKMKMHQSRQVMNLNLALVAPAVTPHLAIIDGFEAMEGNGPTEGDLVPWRLAVASTDGLAADTVVATMMGFDVDEIGYLHYCRMMGVGVADLANIQIVGNTSLSDCTRSVRPHETYRRQRRWHLPQADRYLLSPEPAHTPW
jgi:uncharacterized protein (DUF362 family)